MKGEKPAASLVVPKGAKLVDALVDSMADQQNNDEELATSITLIKHQ